ncbi:MAG TPA: hypothetical protein VKA84_26825, partial [Gemmatimonadaceae bacterium]|nr:hypothetical protein [Gemmatimonadaceae bacterium]
GVETTTPLAAPGARSASAVPAAVHRDAGPAEQEEATSVHSEFAGVLYLVNLALYLELYADFTRPLRPGLAIPLGDFLALVGERAVGAGIRDDPIERVLAELAGRRANDPPARGFVPPGGAGLRSWLDELAATLESRAAPALGVPAGGALAFLCARPGEVTLTALRLRAHFALAEHPIEIRAAGLDRDPGWVPAAGRAISFHYE